MDTLTESQYKELFNLGKEFELEKTDPNTFKANSSAELRAFADGYKKAREIDPYPVEEATYLKQIGSIVDRIIELEEQEATLGESNKRMTV